MTLHPHSTPDHPPCAMSLSCLTSAGARAAPTAPSEHVLDRDAGTFNDRLGIALARLPQATLDGVVATMANAAAGGTRRRCMHWCA